MKKTKIIATIGPSSNNKKTLKKMFLEGVNVCRLNFSHGNYNDHSKTIKNIRELNNETGLNIAILADLQGPKIRTGKIRDNEVELVQESIIEINSKEQIGDEKSFSINYNKLPNDVKKGEKILLDDGKLCLEVISTNKRDKITTKVLVGGILSSNKGVNLPNTKISMPSLTEKDLTDLEFTLEKNVDWIGLSFVRSSKDIIQLNSN